MSQTASKVNIFWALLTIALGSTTQRSFTGWVLSGDTFGDSLWPHRSSPLVCLTDTVLELRLLVRKRNDFFNSRQEQPPTKPTVRLMKFAIFTFGVFPQAIYIFSIKGIPLVQVVASIFLFSQIFNTTLGYERESEDEAAQATTRTLKARIREGLIRGKARTAELSTFPVTLTCIGLIAHVVALFCMWYFIAAHWKYSWSHARASEYMDRVYYTFWAAACPVGILTVLLILRPERYPRLEWLVFSPGSRAFTFCCWSPGILVPSINLILPPAPVSVSARFLSGGFLVLWVSVVCFYLACVLSFLARHVSTVLGLCFRGASAPTHDTAGNSSREDQPQHVLPIIDSENVDELRTNHSANELPTRPGTSTAASTLAPSQHHSLDLVSLDVTEQNDLLSLASGDEPSSMASPESDDSHLLTTADWTANATLDYRIPDIERAPQTRQTDTEQQQHGQSTPAPPSAKLPHGQHASVLNQTVQWIHIFCYASPFSALLSGWLESDQPVAWTTFGMVNFVTMVFAFLVLLDTSNTVSPGWGDLFS